MSSKNGSGAHEKNGSKPSAPSCPDGLLDADLKAYLDGELAPPRRWLLQRHLARCAACREEISELKRLGEDMKDLDKAVPRPELRARILANLPPPPPHRTPAPRTLGRAVPRLALGGALAVFGVGAAFAMTHFFAHPESTPKTDKGQVAVTLPMPETRYTPNSTPPFISKSNGEVPPSVGNPPVDPFDPAHLKDRPSAPPSHLFAPATPERLPNRPEIHPQPSKPQENLPVPDKLDLKEPVRLALVVKDVDSLYQHIQDRVEKLGGRIVSLTSNGSEERPEKLPLPKNAAPEGSMPIPETQHGNVLTLSVPAAHARTLLHALKQLGTILPTSEVSSAPATHKPVPEPLHTPTGLIQDGGPQSWSENGEGTSTELPSKTRPVAPSRPEAISKTKAEGSVTIILMLYRRLDSSH